MGAEICVAYVVITAVIIAICWNSQSKSLPRSQMYGAAGLFFIGAIILIFGLPHRDNPRGSDTLVYLGVITGIVGAVILVRALRLWGQDSRDELFLKFYNECKRNHIDAFDSPKNRQRGELIAKKIGLPAKDIELYFEKGKALQVAVTDQEEQRVMDDKRQKDQDEFKRLTAFLNYSGREKRIAMLKKERSDCLESASALIGGTSALMKASMKKEHDVAINAGIASGIAGGAWGAATALDTMSKNAEIREHNNAVKQSFQPMQNAAMDAAGDYYSKASKLEREIDNTKTKLVSDDSPEDCLNRLAFSNARVSVTEAGSVIVETTVSCEPFLIFDDVKAVVDGTIMADIFDGNKKIGSAPLVLPKYGAGAKTKLKGMCLYVGKKDKKYKVQYRATNLWAMER